MTAGILMDGDTILQGFKVIDARSDRPTRVNKTPIETGVINIDNKVIDPIKVVVVGLVNQEDWEDVNDYLDRKLVDRSFTFMSVQTKFDIFDNLILSKINSRETPDKYDVGEVTLTFTEILLDDAKGTPSNSENSDTQNNGFVNGI